MKPTFDEWYRHKHGIGFDEEHMHPRGLIGDYIRALSKALRDYVSEMARSGETEESK